MNSEEKAASSLNVPPGIFGRQREAYLALTDDQKRAYRYRWFVVGQPAWACLKYAQENPEDTG